MCIYPTRYVAKRSGQKDITRNLISYPIYTITKKTDLRLSPQSHGSTTIVGKVGLPKQVPATK